MSSYKLSGTTQASTQDVFTVSTSELIEVGTKVVDTTGDIYRYIKAGAAISAGHLVQAPAPYTTALHTVAVNTAAIGDTSVTVTAGAEAVAAGALVGGVLVVDAGTAIGDSYPILSNTAVTGAGGSMTIGLGSPIRHTFGASDTVSVFASPYNGSVEVASSTRQPIGIAIEDIASGSYGWVKSRGLIGALADETLTVGALLTSGTSTAGSVEELDDVTAPITDNSVGYAVMAGVDGQTNIINVTIE